MKHTISLKLTWEWGTSFLLIVRSPKFKGDLLSFTPETWPGDGQDAAPSSQLYIPSLVFIIFIPIWRAGKEEVDH